MPKYTFTFDADEERKFQNILSRLDPEEYTVVEEIKILDKENPRYSERQTTLEMDSEPALTIRMGMKNVKIRRERTEEEIKVEEERDARHKVKVIVQVPPSQMP